jgi:hypothetical protein
MLFTQEKIERSVVAILNPKKIYIITMNQRDDFVKYQTDSLTIVPLNRSDFILGEIVSRHLSESQRKFVSNEEINQGLRSLVKKAKLRSQNAMMRGSKYVSIFMDESELTFTPYQNMMEPKYYEFLRIPTAIQSIPNTDDFSIIGIQLRSAWDRCTFAE